MTAVGERIGRSTTKAFVTSWDNVAYPSKFKNTNILCLVPGALCLVPGAGLGH